MSFQEQYPGGIPAGLIFLPGPKIDKLRGFGWSPLTWMSATQVDYPGPLTIWNGHTTLYAGEYQTWSGLGVTYPGFLLHVHDLDARLRLVSVVTAATGKVQFAVDADLTEWYSFEPADDSWSVAQAGRYILKSDSQLAIIMSRPRPRFAPEIALFVEVCQTTRRRTASDALVYCCRIIRRVWIQRASLEKDHSDRLTYTQFLTAGSNNDSVTIGEELSSDQAWIVDEFHSKYPADEIESVHAPPPPIPSAATGQTVPAVPSKWLSTVKRTIWWPTESTESVAS
jgi:hypothetical protein